MYKEKENQPINSKPHKIRKLKELMGYIHEDINFTLYFGEHNEKILSDSKKTYTRNDFFSKQ